MKRVINGPVTSLPTIKITMYLKPIIYEVSYVVSVYTFNKESKKYQTNINPSRVINGPLSDYGEELTSPLKDEFSEFQSDCLLLIQENGFTVITHNVSEDSEKSEYTVVYGLDKDNKPYGHLIFDIRISDHPFDATFPKELKAQVLQYLKMNNILDGTATKAGIDFAIEKITVGDIIDDTWDRVFNRLDILLKKLRRKVRKHALNRSQETLG